MSDRAIGSDRAFGQIGATPLGNDRVALQRAHHAMTAGCAYLVARAARAPVAAPIMPNVRLRRSGNCLNELDRFLAVLITECARVAGIVETGVPTDETDEMPRGSDTARRLRRIDRHFGTDSSATARLHAIKRIRDLSCGDGMQRPGVWLERDIAVATAGRVAIVAHPTQTPDISDQALAAIAEFYAAIADRLLAYFAKE